MAALHLTEMLAAAAIFVCAFLAWEAMSARTRHCFRIVYGGLGMAAFGLVVLPAYPDYAWLADWLRAGLILSFAVYMILDRRRIDRLRTEPRGGQC